MDIKELALTEDEMVAAAKTVGWKGGYDDNDESPHPAVAKAQIAKALWGVIDQTRGVSDPMCVLEMALEEAGIERPKA